MLCPENATFWTFQTRAGRSLLNFVVVTDDAAARLDAHIEFLFLQGPEKSRLPVPDVNFPGHDLVGLLQPHLTFEVCFRGIVHIENDA